MQNDRPNLEELTERLAKAEGHINAADRRLWGDPARGVWSAHQAIARGAEAWLRLHNALPDLPPMGRYLSQELTQQRLDEFNQAAANTPLAKHLREIAAAEAVVLSESFPKARFPDRPALIAGLDRKDRYLKALRALMLEIEDAIADHYLTWRCGDWARLPDGNIGFLFDRSGLGGWFLTPSIAMRDPAKAIRCWVLPHPAVTAIEPSPDGPIAVPAFYWLLSANRLLGGLRRLSPDHPAILDALEAGLNALLDAAAKAWLIDQRPARSQVDWAYVYARQHLQVLSELAPPAIAAPLLEALRLGEDLADRARRNFRRMPSGWLDETAQILALAETGIGRIEHVVLANLDSAAAWIPGTTTVN